MERGLGRVWWCERMVKSRGEKREGEKGGRRGALVCGGACVVCFVCARETLVNSYTRAYTRQTHTYKHTHTQHKHKHKHKHKHTPCTQEHLHQHSKVHIPINNTRAHLCDNIQAHRHTDKQAASLCACVPVGLCACVPPACPVARTQSVCE